MTRLLSLETTCDETGAAVLDLTPGANVPRILSTVVATQHDLHERYSGVVPEIAARAQLRAILPVIDQALEKADIRLNDIDAIAVATRPGLVGSLIVGLATAKGLAVALNRPLITYDHLEGHLYAAQLANPDEPVYPCVGLVVSGGHTHLYECMSPLDSRLLGGTIDDAAGEAFDKVASLLGLPYPGGPSIERAADGGNPRAFKLPRAFLRDPRLAFSFSGLKTAVLYTLRDHLAPDSMPSPTLTADLAASFQAAVVDVLAAKARQALEANGADRLCVGGGVAANSALRTALTTMTHQLGVRLYIPPLDLCTDNAALGGIAFAKLLAGRIAPLDADVHPGLIRAHRNTA